MAHLHRWALAFLGSGLGGSSVSAAESAPRQPVRLTDRLASLQGRICAWHHVWLRTGLYVLADARLAGLPESEADMHHRFRCGGEHMRTDGNPRFARRVPDRAAPPAAHHVGEHRSRKGAVMSNRRMVLLGSLSLLAACGAPRPERAGGIAGAPRRNGRRDRWRDNQRRDARAGHVGKSHRGNAIRRDARVAGRHLERHGSDRHCLYDQGCRYGADDHRCDRRLLDPW